MHLWMLFNETRFDKTHDCDFALCCFPVFDHDLTC